MRETNYVLKNSAKQTKWNTFRKKWQNWQWERYMQQQQQHQKTNTKTIITQMNTLAIIIINYFWARCVCAILFEWVKQKTNATQMKNLEKN